MKIALKMVAEVAPLVIGLAKEKLGNGMPDSPEIKRTIERIKAAKP